MKKLIKDLAQAFENLNNKIDEQGEEKFNNLITGYPFCKSFDELTLDVIEWNQQVNKKKKEDNQNE